MKNVRKLVTNGQQKSAAAADWFLFNASDRNWVKTLVYVLVFFHEKNVRRPREKRPPIPDWQANCLSLIRMRIIELLQK